MRLQIIKPLSGDIDGVPLGRFVVGKQYDVSATLGSFLLVLGAAVPVIDGHPVAAIPQGKPPRKPMSGRKKHA